MGRARVGVWVVKRGEEVLHRFQGEYAEELARTYADDATEFGEGNAEALLFR
jgi:hypothetical protein